MPRTQYDNPEAETLYDVNDVNKRVIGEHKDTGKAQMKQVLGDDYQSMRDGLIKEGHKRGAKYDDLQLDNPKRSWPGRSIYGDR